VIANNIETRGVYVGDGSQSSFAIPFPVYEYESIVVYVLDAQDARTDLNSEIDFIIPNLDIMDLQLSLNLLDEGQAFIDGGNLATGYSLYIEYTNEAFQPTNLRNLGPFAPVAIEKALDRVTMAVKRSVDFVLESFQDLTQLLQDFAALESRVDDAEISISNIENDINSLDGRVDQVETSISNIENDINSLDGRVDQVEQDVTAIENDTALLDGRVDQVEQDVTAIENDINSLDGRVDQVEQDITALTIDVSDAEDDILAIKNFIPITTIVNVGGALAAQSGNLFVVKTNDAVTVNLPAVPVKDSAVYVKRRGSTGDIVVNGNGANIDGNASFQLPSSESAVTIIYDGSEWLVI
jgi:archaellum component FlaC